MKKLSSVSIVIPVYNEAAYIAACLDAISGQTVRPHEVIVVDNNSTDDTVAIAEQYDFVTVIHEERQGVVYARDAGFNRARGDIIGRIDGDTIMAPDWVATVQRLFADSSAAAITGVAAYYDIAAAEVINYFDLKIRHYTARVFGSKVALQGANMAIRRSAWRAVRDSVCRSGHMHEDFDLAVHLYRHGFTNSLSDDLKVRINYRTANYSLPEFVRYCLLSPRTYTRHGLWVGAAFYPVVIFVVLCYPFARTASRGYSRSARKFSLAQLQAPVKSRVNPATYGD